ncbi:MAG TPA: type IA DNA topoisomerase, partial [Candidatus Poseidoniales archaeon]
IAWRLMNIFSEFPFVTRVTFNEITKEAVENALENHRDIDEGLVDAAKVRRFMDRLVGFRCSKFAKSWNLRSMGRVQTPTLGYIVDRENERNEHVPIPYHTVHATSDGYTFKFRFHESSDDEAWRDDNGKFFSDRTFDRLLAENAFEALENS